MTRYVAFEGLLNNLLTELSTDSVEK